MMRTGSSNRVDECLDDFLGDIVVNENQRPPQQEQQIINVLDEPKSDVNLA